MSSPNIENISNASLYSTLNDVDVSTDQDTNTRSPSTNSQTQVESTTVGNDVESDNDAVVNEGTAGGTAPAASSAAGLKTNDDAGVGRSLPVNLTLSVLEASEEESEQLSGSKNNASSKSSNKLVRNPDDISRPLYPPAAEHSLFQQLARLQAQLGNMDVGGMLGSGGNKNDSDQCNCDDDDSESSLEEPTAKELLAWQSEYSEENIPAVSKELGKIAASDANLESIEEGSSLASIALDSAEIEDVKSVEKDEEDGPPLSDESSLEEPTAEDLLAWQSEYSEENIPAVSKELGETAASDANLESIEEDFSLASIALDSTEIEDVNGVKKDEEDGHPLPVELAALILEAAEDAGHPAGGGENIIDLRSNKLEQLSGSTELLHPHAVASLFQRSQISNESVLASKEYALFASTKVGFSHAPTVPFNYAEFEDGNDEAKKKTDIAPRADSTLVPSNDNIEMKMERNNQCLRIPSQTNNEASASQSGVGQNTTCTGPPTNENIEEESIPGDSEGVSSSTVPNAAGGQLNTNTERYLELETQQESMPMLEAFLVEEVIAIPLKVRLTWWRHRTTRLILVTVLGVVLALSIALGISISQNRINAEMVPDTVISQQSQSTSVTPSFSASPSTKITNIPSLSSGPPFSPTACAEKMYATAQKVNSQRFISPFKPKVAVDGRNMVVTRYLGSLSVSYVSVIFYTLTNYGWERVNFFREENPSEEYTIVISGTTALLGLPAALESVGVLIMYERKGMLGDWEKIETPSIPTNDPMRWSWSLDLDGDLACVGGRDSVSIFQRPIDFHLDKWVQLDMINIMRPSGCFVAGHTVAIKSEVDGLQLYKYDQDLSVVLPLQDPISANITLATLDQDNLVFFDETSVNIYRKGVIEMFALSQQFDYSDRNGSHVSIDNGILVIGGSNNTVIFSEHNGYWKESTVLDRSYDDYKVSGRNLLVTMDKDVYSFDLQDCTQTMPTQIPTSSMIPTMVPCYGVDIAVVYDEYPYGTSWELQLIDEVGDTAVLTSHAGAFGDIFHTEFMCLPEGEYNFTIIICCSHEGGRYNITATNGGMIATGGDFGFSDTTTFFIPFNPTLSLMPSLSLTVTPSSPPSMVPSITSFPSMTHIDALFETDCSEDCEPEVAICGDTAVVTRDNIDIKFFSSTNSSFELVTKMDIDFDASSAAIINGTAVIGSMMENNLTGAVYVYEKDQNGIWNETMRIQPADIRQEARFGCSVAIDSDVLIVGAIRDGEEEQGSVYIYRRNETTWTEEAKLSPIDDSDAATFGTSVSVQGNTIVVGDHHYKEEFGTAHHGEGALFVYKYDSFSDSWNKLGGTLTNDDCNNFGGFVRLTHDDELLVGCGSLLGQNNAVYYYEKGRMGDEYDLQQRIGFDNLVLSIAVDGNTMVVSDSFIDSTSVIHFFVRENHAWKEVNKIDNPSLNELFGNQVALFGNTTLIASSRNVYLIEDYFSSPSPNHKTLAPIPSPSVRSTSVPSFLLGYYPNSIRGYCINNPPESRNTSLIFHETAEECCEKWFSFQPDECISDSLSPRNELELGDAFVVRKRKRRRRSGGFPKEE